MADIDGIEAMSLTQETASTIDGTEQIVCFDTAEGKRLTYNELVKWICNHVDAADLTQETASTIDGTEQIVCFDTTGKRISYDEVVKWIAKNKGTVLRKDVTLSNTAANTDVSGYYFKQTVSWPGIVDTDVIVDAQVISGSFTYQWMAETAANELRLYFSRQPATSVKIRIWIEKSTVT